jgi:hypothetical protein
MSIGALAWADRSGTAWAWLDIVAGVSVVHLHGAVGARALPPLRAALDAAGALAPAHVVLDLEAAAVTEVTVTLLGLTRRYLRTRGVTMTLVPSAHLRQALLQAHVDNLYDTDPSLSAAVARARSGASLQVVP